MANNQKPRNSNTAAGRALARVIQDLTDNGAELAQFAYDVWKAGGVSGRLEVIRKYGLENLTDEMRLEMFDWLTIRGFGAPMQAVEVTIDDDRSLSDQDLIDAFLRSFSPDDLRAAAERAERVREMAPTTETVQ